MVEIVEFRKKILLQFENIGEKNGEKINKFSV